MKKLILCLVIMLVGISGVLAQSKNGGISEDMLGRIRQGYQGTPEQKAVKNALASNSSNLVTRRLVLAGSLRRRS